MARKAAAGSKPAKGAGKKKGAASEGADNVVPLKAGAMPAAGAAKLGGSNGGDVSHATFLRHVENLREAQKEIDDARTKVSRKVGTYRNLRKQAKDDGVNMKVLDKVIKEQSMTPEELRAEHNVTQTYRQYLGMPIGSQLPLFEPDGGEITPEGIMERNRSEGYQASARGESADKNPNDRNSDVGREWQAGWEEHQAQLREALGRGTNADKERARQNSADF